MPQGPEVFRSLFSVGGWRFFQGQGLRESYIDPGNLIFYHSLHTSCQSRRFVRQ